MLHDPSRHEPLQRLPWDEGAARRMIERIVRDAEESFSPRSHWPMHPLDAAGDAAAPAFDLYFGAGGVVWALHYLEAAGAVELARSWDEYVVALPSLNRIRREARGGADTGAGAACYLAGETGLLLLAYELRPHAETAAQLESLIAGNLDHPARELMLGAPGTMLAALFMHERTGERRWEELYLASTRKLRSQLLWSDEYRCHYWAQLLSGYRCSYLGGVHGFAATAAPIIRGRRLMEPGEWEAWERDIVDTFRHTAQREGAMANWAPGLAPEGGGRHAQKRLMQFCHGAPGIVVCLADLPTRDLDDELVAGGEAIWNAGPLTKGSNLCHGTGGNGYAFLKLHERTGDERWLARARAFAMHGIAQTEAHARQYGRMRHSLWTGDPGFAIFLWDCIRGSGQFPTLGTFFIPSK